MLRLVNYYEHPSDKKYMVYEFKTEAEAIYFEQQLILKEIPYEKGEDEKEGVLIFFYGVRKKYQQDAFVVNTDTLLKHKNSFIPGKGLKWFVLLLTLSALIFAIVGYIKSTG